MKRNLDWTNTHSPIEVNFRIKQIPKLLMKWIIELSEFPLLTEENHFSWSINLKLTGIDKTWTSHVNKLCTLIFIHSWIYHCTLFTYLTLLYIFLYMFGINHTLVDLMQGCIKIPRGEYHSVHLEPPFPSLWLRVIRVFTLVFHSEWLLLLRWPGTCADFPAKCEYDITGMSCDDVPMTWDFQMMTFVSQLHQGLGGIKGWMYGEGVASSEILGAELIGLN